MPLAFIFIFLFSLLRPPSVSAQFPLSCCTNPGGRACGASCGLDPNDGTGNDFECYTSKTAECNSSGSWMCYVAPGADHGTCYHPEICPAPGSCAIPTPTFLPTPTLPPHFRYWPCSTKTSNPEFHPLRPYPASPCDPYIPRKIPEASPATDNLYLSYSCGKSANPSSTLTAPSVVEITYSPGVNNFMPDPPNILHYTFVDTDPAHRTMPLICADWTPGNVQLCIFAKIVYNVSLDYSDAIFPIFGATQNSANLNDKNKVNNYLSWYLNGTVLQAEQKDLDPDNPDDMNRLINFSGPALKLLSRESQETLRKVLINEAKTNRRFVFLPPNAAFNFSSPNIHNYIVEPDPITMRLKNLFLTPDNPNIPLASTEDIVSEVQPALILAGQPTMPEIDGRITRIGLYLGAADSRLYFPHLRNSNAVSDLVAGTFRPLNPDTSTNDMNIGKNTDPQNRNFVSQWIDKWQGIHDNTKTFFPLMDFITKKSTRNTEVIPYQPAPTPLFTDYANRFVGVSDQRCDISKAKNKPGDSLLGTAIPATLTVYQLFRYTPLRIIPNTGSPPGSICDYFGLTLTSTPSCKEEPCTRPGSPCTSDGPFSEGSCCWGSCPYYNPCQLLSMDPEYYCDAAFSGGGNPCNADYEDVVAWPHPSAGDCYSNGVLVYTAGNFVCCGPAPEPTYNCEENPYPDTPRGTCAIIGAYPCGDHDLPTTCSSYGDCCSWEVDQVGRPPHPPTPTCSLLWPRQELKNAGRIAIFVKTPMVERIYDTLVSGEQSLLRRFLPKKPDDVADDKYIKIGKYALPGAGSADYSAVSDPSGADVNNVHVSAGSGGAPALYFPKVGSLYDYILGGGREKLNLQCLLRPQGSCNAKPAAAVTCADLPLPADISVSETCGLCNSDLGDLALKILTVAGETFNVPAAAIFATMQHEGATRDAFQGEFTDENVCKWSLPISSDGYESMPTCDNENSASQPPFGFLENWFYLGDGRDAVWTAVQEIDPSRDARDKVSRCNFMDAAFAAAKMLHINSAMIPPAVTNATCGSYRLTNNTRSTNCSWSDSLYVQARVAYSAYCPEPGYNDGYAAIPNFLATSVGAFEKYKCY